jgi:hypothetical protein
MAEIKIFRWEQHYRHCRIQKFSMVVGLYKVQVCNIYESHLNLKLKIT